MKTFHQTFDAKSSIRETNPQFFKTLGQLFTGIHFNEKGKGNKEIFEYRLISESRKKMYIPLCIHKAQ